MTGLAARLHHIALGARDVEALAAFYRDVFALSELARHAEPGGAVRAIWLDLGGPILMIERTQAVRERVEGIGAGMFLIAFDIRPSERAALERALEARGHLVESRTEFTSYARDPEGNRIAFSHFPARRPEESG